MKSDMYFTEEIIEQVLVRLPVKSLTKLKIISKRWNDLISDSRFHKRYISQHQRKCGAPTGFICINRNDNSYGAFYLSTNYVENKELKSLNYLSQFGKVLAASKGLLLLCHNRESLHVHDLVSKKTVNLQRNLEFGKYLALGFKCDEKSTNDSTKHSCYKVVRVDNDPFRSNREGTRYTVEIYSSESGTWQKSFMKADSVSILSNHSIAKVIDGVFHWYDYVRHRVIAYDSDDPSEHVVLIQLPSSHRYYVHEVLRGLEGTKDGSLQFITTDYRAIDVWIMSTRERNYMDEDTVDISRWILARRVNPWDNWFSFEPQKYLMSFIGVDSTDADILYLQIKNRLYTYNHQEEKVVSMSLQEISLSVYEFLPFELPTFPRL